MWAVGAPFATATEYRTLGFHVPSGTPDDRLSALLARASRTLRAEVRGLDDRIIAGTLDLALVADVACEMVESAISSDAGPGVESMQVGTGPYQGTLRFANPRGDMFVTSKHKRILRGGGSGRAFTIKVKGSS